MESTVSWSYNVPKEVDHALEDGHVAATYRRAEKPRPMCPGDNLYALVQAKEEATQCP